MSHLLHHAPRTRCIETLAAVALAVAAVATPAPSRAGPVPASKDPSLGALTSVFAIHDLSDERHGVMVRLFESSGGDPMMNGNRLLLAVVPSPEFAPRVWETGLDVHTVRGVTLDPRKMEMAVDVTEHVHGGEAGVSERTQRYTIRYEVDPEDGEVGETIRVAGASGAGPVLTDAVLRGATYPSTDAPSGSITLKGGQFEDLSVPLYVELRDPIARGDIDGDGVDDAVVFLTVNTGGSGGIVEATAVLNRDGTPKAMRGAALGDRVEIEAAHVEDRRIVIELKVHADDDPLCCPSKRVTKRFALAGGALREITAGE